MEQKKKSNIEFYGGLILGFVCLGFILPYTLSWFVNGGKYGALALILTVIGFIVGLWLTMKGANNSNNSEKYGVDFTYEVHDDD